MNDLEVLTELICRSKSITKSVRVHELAHFANALPTATPIEAFSSSTHVKE